MSATVNPATVAGPGLVDRFFGPGHSRLDLTAQGIAGVLCAGLFAWYLVTSPARPHWSVWQLVLLGVMVLDLIGGILTMSTTAAKIWYHRAGPTARRTRLVFVSSHVVHLALVALVLLEQDWIWLVVSGLSLLTATLVIEFTPRAVKRVAATGSFVAVLVLGLIMAPLPAALAWFPALFYLKLLVCFLVPESEPRDG